MYIKCGKEKLLENINLVQRAVSAKTTHPILECILLTCDSNGFRMFSTDQEIAIKTVAIECEIIEAGAIALPSKFFSEIVRKLPEGEVSVKVEERFVVKIKCGSSEFKIVGMNPDDFPEIEDIDRENKYEISQSVFKDLIKRTIFSVCQDNSKPNLMGSCVELASGSLNMITCDAFRVSLARGGRPSEDVLPCSAIVPYKAISELQRLLEDDGIMDMYITEKRVLYDIGSCTMFSRLIEGEFINYAGIFPEEFKTKVTLGRNAFTDALERAALVSYYENKKNPVRLKMKENIVTITTTSETGNSFEEIEGDMFGEELEIAFNPKFLIEALKTIEEEEITIELNTPLSPCVIRPANDSGDCKYLVLPLRVKN